MNAYMVSYMYTNGRVLRFVCIHFGLHFLCTQMVECSGMYMYIKYFVFIFEHTTGTVLYYKGLNYICHTRLFYRHPRLLDMEACLSSGW